MEKETKALRVLCALVVTAIMAGFNMSCSGDDDSGMSNTPTVPEYVTNPVKAVRYEQSEQFKSDFDCVNQLACVLRSMTWNN